MTTVYVSDNSDVRGHPRCVLCALVADTRWAFDGVALGADDAMARTASLGCTLSIAGDHHTGPDEVIRRMIREHRR
jgi:hypothetical protein